MTTPRSPKATPTRYTILKNALLLACVRGIVSVGLLCGGARAGEATIKPPAHAHEPALRSVHGNLLDLLPVAAASDVSARDGDWSDPQTWKAGRPPAADADVVIPEGTTVTLDRVEPSALRSVRVDGTLRFATDRDPALAPPDAVAEPRFHALVGSPSTYATPVRSAVVRTTQKQGFQLAAFSSGKKTVVRSRPVDLRDGWNLITAPAEDGIARSFLVFAGDSEAAGKERGHTEKYEK